MLLLINLFAYVCVICWNDRGEWWVFVVFGFW